MPRSLLKMRLQLIIKSVEFVSQELVLLLRMPSSKNTNDGAGLLIGPNPKIGPVAENEITLSGDISITNHFVGVDVFGAKSTVRVTGNLISNHNRFGILAKSADLTIALGGSNSGKSGKSGGSGSITACGNTEYDIINLYPAIPDEGSDYTCGEIVGFPESVCKPCYPGCPSPSPSESAQFSETQQIASYMAEDLDIVAMDMEYPLV